MKMKVVLVGLATASVVVSSALAAPPPGKGKPPASGPGCRPMITVVVKGTLASTPGASAISLSVNVTSGNHWGQAYVTGTQPVSISVNSATKVRRQGKKTLGDLLKDDLVLVQARACKADLANNATPPLTARMVVAHPPNAHGSNNDNDGD
jgi:hypothetical protein